MYKPLIVKSNSRPQVQLSAMGTKGVNLRDLPQFLKPEYAQTVKNYYSTADGRLIKRKGLDRLFTVADSAPGTMLEVYTEDLYVFGYGTTTAIYSKSADTITEIKTDWTGANQCGARYGDYFFVCDGEDEIHRIQQILEYDNQSGNFTVGLTVTGQTSGATAIILEDTDGGATGILVLGNIQGVFEDGEELQDTSTGVADADGVLGFSIVAVSGSPKASYLRAIDTRLFAAQGDTVFYSNTDDGSNPPFDDWTVAVDATDPGSVYSRRLGNINAIESLGPNIVVFCENGKYAFQIVQQDIAGTLSKTEVFQIFRVDFGGARGAITTPKGLFYWNESGLWQFVSLGQLDIPFSDQEFEVTPIIGGDYFNNIDIENISIVFDPARELLLVTYAKDASINNQVMAYNFQTKGITFFSGWTINRFMVDRTEIYAISSQNATTWKVFEGNDDDGNDIETDFSQEITLGSVQTRQILQGLYCQGFLSPSTNIRIRLSIYDVNGVYVGDKLVYNWIASTGGGSSGGYDQLPYGDSYGGDLDTSGLIEDFNGIKPWIRNFQRLELRLTCTDKLPHQINWIRLEATPKVNIRKRKLTKV